MLLPFGIRDAPGSYGLVETQTDWRQRKYERIIIKQTYLLKGANFQALNIDGLQYTQCPYLATDTCRRDWGSGSKKMLCPGWRLQRSTWVT